MAEYSKKTVVELQEILKSRGLPISGKKADLVARLNEADKAAETETAAETAPEAEAETTPAEPVDAPAPEPATDATTTETDGKVEESADATAEAAPAAETKTFTLNLAGTDVDDEMARRKARAERFKLETEANPEAPATEEAAADPETLKKLERAKRFGEGQTGLSKLDEALPTEGPRGRRGRKHHADDSHGNKRGHGPNMRRRGGPGKPTGVSKPAAAYTSKEDRDAAETRKKRFAAAS